MAPCDAPREARTASSRRRAAPRARNRFATFAQAMSNTKATAPNSSHRAVFALLLRKLFRNGSTLALRSLYRPGSELARCRATATISA